MPSIQPIGSYLPIDAAGYIVNPAAFEKIQESYLPAIHLVQQMYLQHFGKNLHSVYLRGSVAKGEALEDISDIDSFAVVTLKESEINTDWSKEFDAMLREKYPFITGVEITAIPMENLDEYVGDKIMIKTQSVCIYGEDIAPSLSPFKPDNEMAQHIRGIKNEIVKTVDWLNTSHSAEDTRAKCTWIMKRILRSGFELVMEDLQKYTRDLYPCYLGFAEIYPEQKHAMYRVLELAVNPISEREEIQVVLNGIGQWLINKVDQKSK